MEGHTAEVLPEVAAAFQCEGTYHEARPYGAGHINDTYLVSFAAAEPRAYIFQRINTQVFKDPAALMENIRRVTSHMRRKLEDGGVEAIDRRVLTLVPVASGGAYYVDRQGGFWRCYLFIHPSITLQVAFTPDQAHECGRAYGEFQALLGDLPGGPLHDTIPCFHDLDRRLESLEEAFAAAPRARVAAVGTEMEFARRWAEPLQCLTRLYRNGGVPRRITHNDTKINNVLLDPAGRALCVIDLDTVMNGTLLYDYGDALRTVASSAPEDEPDPGRMRLDLERFGAFSTGYLEKVGGLLTDAEWEHLAWAPPAMTFTIAVRFLTDYLAGDVYFKVRYPEHNRVRAQAQCALCRSMLAGREAMAATVRSVRRGVAPS